MHRNSRTLGGAVALALASALPQAQAQQAQTPSPIIELRQYRIVPGQRDAFLDLFERELVDTQEDVGMKVFGIFRDARDPDRVVWVRGFSDMPARAKALSDFYFGPVWRAQRGSANPLLEESENVLLLREAAPGSGFAAADESRPPRDARPPEGFVAATIWYLREPPGADLAEFFETQVRPVIEEAGLPVTATFVPEPTPNDFPRLPVREGEQVFLWFTRAGSAADLDARIARLEASDAWKEHVASVLKDRLARPPEILRLAPTARSRLR